MKTQCIVFRQVLNIAIYINYGHYLQILLNLIRAVSKVYTKCKSQLIPIKTNIYNKI